MISDAFVRPAMVDKQRDAIEGKRLDVQLDWLNKQEIEQMKKFKELVIEIRKI